jgi:ABC-type enterochelin transport system substrate-binding protein
MSKIDSLLSDVESAIEKLGDVYNGLKELKEEIDAVENARDRMRGRKSKKNDDPN